MFLTKFLKKKSFRSIVFLIPVAALIIAAITLELLGNNKDVLPFGDANIYIELNNTDGDLGLHAHIDGEAWEELEISGPKNDESLKVEVDEGLGIQGLTELFFESAEPGFDELSPAEFFARFPEGEYTIEGETIEGKEMKSITELTHLVPAPPANITVNGIKLSEGCEEEPVSIPLGVDGQVVISWDIVVNSHPELGRTNEPITVDHYQVVIQQEELGFSFNFELPPEITLVEIPARFITLDSEYKLEILVREESGNQTAVETCFIIE